VTDVDTGFEHALELLSGPPTHRALGLAVTRVGRSGGGARRAGGSGGVEYRQEAPTVLLVHGVGAARVVWAPVLPALAERYGVLVVDLPGHGASDPLTGNPRCGALARHLGQACAALGVVRPHVVGNSLGGWIGLEMAADGAAASLVALAPAGLRIRPVTPSPLLRWNRLLARHTLPLADALLDRPAMRRLVFATGSRDPSGLHPALARGMAHALADSTAYEAMLDATAHRRFERKREVTVPTAVVFGDRDWILPAPNQRPELAPDHARWLRWDHCGHAPMWDAPVATVALVDETIRAADRLGCEA